MAPQNKIKLTNLFQDLVQIKDELALQAHLMNMEIKDEWHALENKIFKLESEMKHSLETVVEQLGKSEEHFFVGEDKEIEQLLKEFKDLKNRHNGEDSNERQNQ